jgi:hypothetical protein
MVLANKSRLEKKYIVEKNVDVLKKQALVGTARKALSICGCVEKAGVGGHSTQGSLNLWMC